MRHRSFLILIILVISFLVCSGCSNKLGFAVSSIPTEDTAAQVKTSETNNSSDTAEEDSIIEALMVPELRVTVTVSAEEIGVVTSSASDEQFWSRERCEQDFTMKRQQRNIR